MFIEDIEYMWKTKGTGSKIVVSSPKPSPEVDKELNPTCCSDQLATKENTTVAESHSKRRNGFFKKARDMSLEVSGVVFLAVDVILLTFIFVWKERRKVPRPLLSLASEKQEFLSPLQMDWAGGYSG